VVEKIDVRVLVGVMRAGTLVDDEPSSREGVRRRTLRVVAKSRLERPMSDVWGEEPSSR